MLKDKKFLSPASLKLTDFLIKLENLDIGSLFGSLILKSLLVKKTLFLTEFTLKYL